MSVDAFFSGWPFASRLSRPSPRKAKKATLSATHRDFKQHIMELEKGIDMQKENRTKKDKVLIGFYIRVLVSSDRFSDSSFDQFFIRFHCQNRKKKNGWPDEQCSARTEAHSSVLKKHILHPQTMH